MRTRAPNLPPSPSGSRPAWWFALLLLPVASWGNLIANGDFEVGGVNTVAGFSTHFFEGTYQFRVITDGARSGGRCVAIAAPQKGWARWYTTDVFLLKGARYRLSCWVRSDCPEDTATPGDVWLTGCGANLRLPVDRSTQWRLVQGECSPTETGRGGLYLQLLGAGEVFFDDVALEMVAPPPAEPGESAPTDGEPLDAIVIPAQPALHHLYLADLARRLLQEMTGSTLAIRPGDGPTEGRAFYIDVSPPGRDFAADVARLDDEGIVVDIGPDGICCLGRTARALNYAVTEAFRVLGCRW